MEGANAYSYPQEINALLGDVTSEPSGTQLC